MHPKSSLFSAGRAGIRIKKLHFLSGGWTFPQLCNKITPDRNSSSLLIHLAKARFISAHSRAFPSILPGLCNLLSACTSTLPVQVASTFTPQHSRLLSCSPAGLPPPRRPLYLVVVARHLVPAPAQLLGQFHVLLLQSLELLGLVSRCQLERLAASTQRASLPWERERRGKTGGERRLGKTQNPAGSGAGHGQRRPQPRGRTEPPGLQVPGFPRAGIAVGAGLAGLQPGLLTEPTLLPEVKQNCLKA